MRMTELILKKKNGGELSSAEIRWMISGYTAGSIPDYQMSAMMMAVCFQGMNRRETADLTMSMAESGDMLDLSQIEGIKVDKHSTGGVGDKTSLIVAPIAASCGVPIAKMSGRGLGHTGGTIDKLESFPGFRTSLCTDAFIRQVNTVGMAIMGQTADLAPADKKLYALRDVTGTVENMSLIAASIMSKKLAAGSDGIVLDVKTGSGAFMKNEEDAFALAKEMVGIGRHAGRTTLAVVSDMDQPLGSAVGNALEVKEVIACLSGNWPEDLHELCLTLASYLILTGKKASSFEAAMAMAEDSVKSGKALQKLAEFVKAQGGNPEAVSNTGLLPAASLITEVKSREEGYINHIACDEVGRCSLLLGGGRETKESTVDLSVGLILHKKKGDFVKKGECLAQIHANDPVKAAAAAERYLDALAFSTVPVKKQAMIKGIVRE